MTATDDTHWEARVASLWEAFDAHAPADFVERVGALAGELPADDPRALFELACAHDSTGNEAEAERLYRAALEGGLTGLRRRRAAIQYASTLRNLGRADESARLLYLEREQPSDALDDAVTAFLALALTDLGREREAAALALGALAPHLPRYQRSLRNYAAGLVE